MIRFENVDYIYRDMGESIHALHDISLEIPEGEVTAVIGHTGSGKSTLVQMINGLEKPSSGRVFVGETEITDKKCDFRALRFRVGMVFQYPEQQLFEETVERDIVYGPKNMGLDDEEIQSRVQYASQLTGLNEEQLKKSPFELSGGEKRRAAIAGVIAMKPEILILDEPYAGLDPAGRREMSLLIKKFHKEGMTIIFISHSMEDVAELAQNVVVLNHGRLALAGSTDAVFGRSNELEKMGLDIPQTAKLCARLRAAGFNLLDGIFTISDAAKYIGRELNV